MKEKWQSLIQKNRFAKKLISLFDKRCKTTLDIELSETAFFFSSAGLNEFAKTYKFYETPSIENPEQRKSNDERIKKVGDITEKVQFLCDSWKLEAQKVIEVFLEITKKERIYHEKYATISDLLTFKIKVDPNKMNEFDAFITRLRVLPASEASCERIFAMMRDSFNYKMKSMKPDTLKSTLVLNFHNFRSKIINK